MIKRYHIENTISYRNWDPNKGEIRVDQLQLGFFLNTNFMAFNFINGGNMSTLKNHVISVYWGTLSHTVVLSTSCHCRSQTTKAYYLTISMYSIEIHYCLHQIQPTRYKTLYHICMWYKMFISRNYFRDVVIFEYFITTYWTFVSHCIDWLID